jgi:hypothetical protein
MGMTIGIHRRPSSNRKIEVGEIGSSESSSTNIWDCKEELASDFVFVLERIVVDHRGGRAERCVRVRGDEEEYFVDGR